MIRPRTALTVTAIAAVTAAGGAAVAGAVDRPDAGGTSSGVVVPAAGPAVVSPATGATAAPTAHVPATPRAAHAGDDGLTHAQATKARAAALRAVSGRVTQIERDADGGRVTYDVTVLTKAGKAREVHLDRAFRATRTTNEDRDGLTYATAGKAASAATKRVKGLVTGIDVEDEGRARYEVEVLTSSSVERTVRLTASYAVVTGGGDHDGDD
ncbi:PepSY domain-containing protein [Patulibacter sp. NPDC049589]|uniref:PepSY domain-containing protein n=1 Tax=Patulibacter sp. NPDC049589 TaxID=3154731 RepID=UPI0034289C58